jgi:aspartate racemase
MATVVDVLSKARVAKHRLGGVLGGMGPLATVDFLTKVIEVTPARCDQDHIPLLVHQVPQIPDRSAAILAGNDAPFAPMLDGLRRLAAAGAQFAVIPCISAHHWYERLVDAQPLEILHIADAVLDELQARRAEAPRLALLATRGTLHSGIYTRRFGTRATLDLPGEPTQQLLDRAISAVKGGELSLASHCAEQAADQLLQAGAEALVLACTELPIAFHNSRHAALCVDSTRALARLCLATSYRLTEI